MKELADPMSRIFLEEIGDAEGLAALRDDWRALAAEHGEGLPFRTWEWNDAWWRWFGEDRVAVRDELFVRAFRDGDGRLVGVAPLILVLRPGVGAPLVRGLEFFGLDPDVTELRGALVEVGREDEVHRALIRHLEERSGAWDWIQWQGVREGSAWARALRDVELTDDTYAFTLPLADGVSRTVKDLLRKGYAALKRDEHPVEFGVVRDIEEMPAAVDRVLELHRRAGRVDARHPEAFEDIASQAFLTDVCTRLAARDAVRVFQLRVRGEVVATRLGFALGTTLYLYLSGHDASWSRYSVTTIVVAEAIQYAFANGFDVVHFSTHADPSDLRFRPQKTLYRSGVAYAAGVRGTAARLVHAALEASARSRLGQSARKLLGRRRGVLG
jgi:CelD/BcsL family acetyltransferase involved in cellulose biosynthesis